MVRDKNSQLELFTIVNPCIGVCQSNPRGYCIGCLRSREERFNWHLKTEQEQRKIIQLLTQRKARLAQQQKSHPTKLIDESQPASAAQASLFDQPDSDTGHK